MVVKHVVKCRQRQGSVDFEQRLIDRVFDGDVPDLAGAESGLGGLEGFQEWGVVKQLISALTGSIRGGHARGLAREECRKCGRIDAGRLSTMIRKASAQCASTAHVEMCVSLGKHVNAGPRESTRYLVVAVGFAVE